MSISYDLLSRNSYQLLALPFFEATGAVNVKDTAKPHHVVTQTNSPTWTQLPSGLWVLDFNDAIPEFLQISAAASADLNFTSAAFSFVWWMNPDAIPSAHEIICHGLRNVDGYEIYIDSGGIIRVLTEQAGISQGTLTTNTAVVAGIYACWGVSRSGASIRIFRNGRDITSVAAVHINPVTANRKFLIGIYDNEVNDPYDGKLWNPRVFSGLSLSEYEHRLIFEMERKWFGV